MYAVYRRDGLATAYKHSEKTVTANFAIRYTLHSLPASRDAFHEICALVANFSSILRLFGILQIILYTLNMQRVIPVVGDVSTGFRKLVSYDIGTIGAAFFVRSNSSASGGFFVCNLPSIIL